jgi:virginiamycin B lyase
MTTTVDTQGDVWFAEQNANYIGRFDPKQQTFRLFPLRTWQGSPLGPQDIHFDGSGLLWFTAAEAGVLGRLDPRTGVIRLWPVPSSPSTLTVTPTGQVWFGAGGAIGTLDPLTNQTTIYDLPNPQTQVFSMAVDTRGATKSFEPMDIYVLTQQTSQLVVFNLAVETGLRLASARTRFASV